MSQTFTTTVGDGGSGDGTTAFLEVPPEAVAALGRRKRPPVRVTISPAGARSSAFTYRSTVAVYGGAFMLPVRREVREQAGVSQGMAVDVTLELDDAPREVEVPDDLAAELAGLRPTFDALAFSHRKEYVDWIESAKRPETRQRRLGQAAEMLRAGRKTPKG